MRIDELVIELTNWCPHSCMHCSSLSGVQCKDHLSKDVIIELIDEAFDIGVKKISFGGGEPTSSDIFIEILKKINNAGVHTEVFTCGNSIQGNRIIAFSNSLISQISNFNGHVNVNLVFSFHGATSETHDYITQTPGSYNCLVESVKACVKNRILCTANFVPLKPNISEFNSLLDLLTSLKINKVSILRFVPQGRGFINQDILELTREEENIFLNQVLHKSNDLPIEIRFGSPFNGIIPDHIVPCRAGISKLVIQPNGNVLPCEVFKHFERSNWELNIYKKTLGQILSSTQFNTLKKILFESKCHFCPVHSILREKSSSKNYEFSRASI